MHATTGPRRLGLILLLLFAVAGVFLVAGRTGVDDLLLISLAAWVPFAAAGTVAAPLLSGALGFGIGLLGARRSNWTDQSLRSLLVGGCIVCAGWLAAVGTFWFIVQGELMHLLDAEPGGRAGLSALSTLLLPATATVFGAAAVIAGQVRSALREVSVEHHIQTMRSRGQPTSARVIRRALWHSLPGGLAVLVVEFLVLYCGSFFVQAVFDTPTLTAGLPPMLPAESLPVLLGATLLMVVGLVLTVVAALVTGATPWQDAGSSRASGTVADSRTPGGAASALPSRGFRSTDLLDIRDLRPGALRGGTADAVGGISLTVTRGQAVAVVDDSVEGVVLLTHALAGLLPVDGPAPAGSILFDGTELLGLPEREFRDLRGRSIAFIAAPGAGRLDPDVPIGRQVAAVLRARCGASRSTARAEVGALLQSVGIGDPGAVSAAFPHEISPATEQRVLLAAALVAGPEFLVAHDPTDTLCSGEEAAFLDLLHTLQRERGFTLLVASTRLESVVRCDRVAIVHDGAVVEHASVSDLLTAPQHPRSRQLLSTRAPETRPFPS